MKQNSKSMQGVVLAIFAGISVFAAKEKPVKCTAEQVAAIIAKAPKVPVDLGLDLKMKLVDYIDFTDPEDPHDMIDRGTSKIVSSKIGKYRETAAHRHAQFSVRWKAGQQDKAHVLIWEYPDNAKRQICFFTHESRLSGRKNIDWSLESGVYCGDPLPVSNKMQYHTFFFWPNDKWPVAMVMNWIRDGKPAAASRLWVYEVEEELPKLEVKDPDPANPRLCGTVYNWSLVPTRGIFGLTNKKTAIDHIVDYHNYRGDNLISWPVVSNNSWGFKCTIPSWDGGSGKPYNKELDQMLEACDRKGMKFLAIFNIGHRFKIGGKKYSSANRAEREKLLRKGFEEFFQRYGKYKSLYGIAFDTQDLSPKYGEAGLDNIRDSFNGLSNFLAFVKEKAPKLKVYNFLGGRSIHAQFFPDGGDIIKRWEAGRTPWSKYLSDEVNKLWNSWQRNPAKLNKIKDLTTIYAYQHDDHAIFNPYSQNPRAMFYYDMEASPEKAALVDTRAALIWNTFFEGYIGLTPANWWYLKVWVAPDFNPSAPSALAAWARAMQHRDRNIMLNGSWNRKGGGHEVALRRFNKAFRELPPTELKTVQVFGSSPVKVRSGVWKGNTYVSVLNTTCFPAEIVLNLGKKRKNVKMTPFELVSFQTDGSVDVKASGKASKKYIDWIVLREKNYENLLNEVKELNPAAAPAPYNQHLTNARKLLKEKKYLAGDVALGHALTTELALRKSILAPLQQKVPKITPPPMNGDLNAWPKEAADIQSSDANIGTHLFFTSQWEGEKDLSARVRLGHDEKKLYIAIAVKDNKLTPKDAMTLFLSPAKYKLWLNQKEKYEKSYSFPLPRNGEVKLSGRDGFTGTCRKTSDGYVAEASITLADLKLKSGSTIGWVIQISDDDNTSYLANNKWARKSIMIIPNVPHFAYWSDARTCCELILE